MMGKRAAFVFGVAVAITACGADRPPAASEDPGPPVVSDASAPATTFAIEDGGVPAIATCLGPNAQCKDTCCEFTPFYCNALGSPAAAALGTFYPFGAGTPAYTVDTGNYYTPPASLALTSPAGGSGAMRFEGMTTLTAGHPVQISFWFYVDGDNPPPEIARFEIGTDDTLQMRLEGANANIYPHHAVSPWSAPFTDSPASNEGTNYTPRKWIPIAFDVASETPFPLSIVLGSTVPGASASTVYFDELQLEHLPCSARPDAGTTDDAGVPGSPK